MDLKLYFLYSLFTSKDPGQRLEKYNREERNQGKKLKELRYRQESIQSRVVDKMSYREMRNFVS
jgi:hypothetical protein